MTNSQPPYQAGNVDANGISLRYYRSGGNKPPIVLAHGMTDMGLCWTRVANGLRHKYDVVVYDARGHGKSDAPPTGYDPESHSEDLHGLLLGLKLDRPRLLGHSLGAMTVALLAAKHPELVRSVVLEDPPMPERLDQTALPDQLKAWQNHWIGWKTSVIEQLSQSRLELEALCRRQSPHWHDSEIEFWADAKLSVSPRILVTPHLMTRDWWRCLPKIGCPALLLTADTQRGALLSEAAEGELRRSCPSMTFVRLSGSGHNIHREQFERYMALVADFFARN